MAVEHNQEWLNAQYSVLGSILISPEVTPMVMTETSESDFNGPCRTVYKAIRQLFLAGTTIDAISIADALGGKYNDFLMQLMEITPTAANVRMYITKTREQARVIAAQELGRQIAQAEGVDQIRGLLEKASGLLVDRPSVRVTTMSEALKSFMTRHTAKPEYLTWPIPALDNEIYAEPGDMIVIGGRPSAGKTAWALQCGWHWAQKYKVGIFSLETSAEKMFDRQMAAVARISMGDIKRNQISDSAWAALAQKGGAITSTNLELIRAAGMSPADIRALTVMRGYQIIIIDYLQLLQASGENRTAQVTSISIALHTLAQSLGVTVVALSQMAREGQNGAGRGMAALRESGQIEQDADVVILLSLEKSGESGGNRVLDIAKNKEGTCPSVLLAFDGMYQTFSKAQRDTLKQYASGRRQRQQPGPAECQMSILPNDTPVPFEEGVG